MNLFGYRYVSRSLGFAMGWLYFYSLGILVPYEITAAGLVIDYWGSDIHIAVWISIMTVFIIGLNALPVKYYGETEFWCEYPLFEDRVTLRRILTTWQLLLSRSS
jgi:amino acid transporter